MKIMKVLCRNHLFPFLVAASKEKDHSGTFQSFLRTLLAQNNLLSIVMEGIAPPSLYSLLGSLNSENIIDNIGEVSSDELSHQVLEVSEGNFDEEANK